MAIESPVRAAPVAGSRTTPLDRRYFAAGYDWLMAGLSLWLLVGMFLDAWAHSHIRNLETFFTPWHGVLYASLAALLGATAVTVVHARSRGRAWRRVMPAGYGLTLAGAALFAVGGLADMGWHLAFGIETDVAATISPSHLTLAVAFTLIVSGPMRAAWGRAGRVLAGPATIPALFSIACTLSIFSILTSFAHPVFAPQADRSAAYVDQVAGEASILIQSVLLVGVMLFVQRRWQLPPGGWTLVLGINVLLMAAVKDQYRFIPAGLVAGAVADVLARRLPATPDNPAGFRWFGLAVPLALYALYFVTVAATSPLRWPVHLWLGAIFSAGAAGYLLSLLALPPVTPAEA